MTIGEKAKLCDFTDGMVGTAMKGKESYSKRLGGSKKRKVAAGRDRR